MIVVDTSVWIDYLQNFKSPQADWLDREVGRQRLGLTDLNLCEVLQGVRDERQAEQTRRALARFELVSTGGERLALAAARNYRMLRSKGRTVRKTIDCLIATTCLLNDYTLLHNDPDFDSFEEFLGLRVVPL